MLLGYLPFVPVGRYTISEKIMLKLAWDVDREEGDAHDCGNGVGHNDNLVHLKGDYIAIKYW